MHGEGMLDGVVLQREVLMKRANSIQHSDTNKQDSDLMELAFIPKASKDIDK